MASKWKAQSQVVTELRATWTGHIWDKATTSGNSIQEAKMGLNHDPEFFKKKKKKLHLDIKKLHPHRCMYMGCVCARVCFLREPLTCTNPQEHSQADRRITFFVKPENSTKDKFLYHSNILILLTLDHNQFRDNYQLLDNRNVLISSSQYTNSQATW